VETKVVDGKVECSRPPIVARCGISDTVRPMVDFTQDLPPDSAQALPGRQAHKPNVERMAKVGIVIACAGALVLVIDLFGLALVGLGATVVGAALAFPYGAGERWYYSLAGGAIVGVIALIVSGPNQTTGGWLAVTGVLAVLIGGCLGYPGARD
jgi:hypothetical protein